MTRFIDRSCDSSVATASKFVLILLHLAGYLIYSNVLPAPSILAVTFALKYLKYSNQFLLILVMFVVICNLNPSPSLNLFCFKSSMVEIIAGSILGSPPNSFSLLRFAYSNILLIFSLCSSDFV